MADINNNAYINLRGLTSYHGKIQAEIDGIQWQGTQAEFEEAQAAGKITDGMIINITDDADTDSYYTKSEVDQLMSNIPKFNLATTTDHTQITNPSTTTVYLENGESGVTLYTEWIYINDDWYKLGEQPITSATVTSDGTLII